MWRRDLDDISRSTQPSNSDTKPKHKAAAKSQKSLHSPILPDRLTQQTEQRYTQ